MSGEKFVVVATDKVSKSGLEPLLSDPRFEVLKIDDSKTQEFKDALPRAHGLIVRSATKVHREMLKLAPELRIVGRAGVGIDNIDVDACTERGVAVCNAPGGNTIAAAELTLALMLAVVRQVPAGDASMRAGDWARAKFQGAELRGRTLGLIGAGRIGGEVAKRCLSFGMRVIANDPYLTDERAHELGVERATREEVIEKADVLSLHVPLTADTQGMIGTETLARMKKGAYVINVARGGVVDEAALVEALKSGQLAGAALDVFANEPLEADSPLRTAPNLVITPHLGASTAEAQEMVATEVADTLRIALADGDLSRALNAPGISGAALRKLKPVFELGRKLGRLASAAAPGGVTEIEVRYAGGSEEALRPLTASVLVGFLQMILGDEQVNMVSAAHLAEQRGVRVARTQLARHADYTEFVEVLARTDNGDFRLAGALLGEAHPRIVRYEDYHVDVVPDGTLIVLKNKDVPGVIGRVGTLLGGHGINIAEYHQARRSRGGDALATIAADGEVGPGVRDALLGLEEVTSAVVARLS